ncbi:MAG: conjugal transfer protein TraX [Oscillospiraceae bacterium]|nr:conjugal transfer protein TraX [Oscillospiraceae bacterium]
MERKTGFLNSNSIKLIAVFAMTVDHIAWMLFPGYPTDFLPVIMHIIGRITCPIMCYCVAEGFHYTKNINKYTLRMFLFALISHFAYIFASENYTDFHSFIPFYNGGILNQTSVMWSLAFGLVMLRTAYSEKIKNKTLKVLLILLICVLALPSDWSCVASLFILSFGTNRNNLKMQSVWLIIYAAVYSLVYILAIDTVYGILQMSVVLAIPIIYAYNGERGKNIKFNKFMKWFFYIYYPLHLFIIGILNQYVLK